MKEVRARRLNSQTQLVAFATLTPANIICTSPDFVTTEKKKSIWRTYLQGNHRERCRHAYFPVTFRLWSRISRICQRANPHGRDVIKFQIIKSIFPFSIPNVQQNYSKMRKKWKKVIVKKMVNLRQKYVGSHTSKASKVISEIIKIKIYIHLLSAPSIMPSLTPLQAVWLLIRMENKPTVLHQPLETLSAPPLTSEIKTVKRQQKQGNPNVASSQNKNENFSKKPED